MTDARVNGAGLLSAVGIFALLLLGAACGTKAEKQTTVSPPIRNLTATLEDEVHDLPRGEIEWSTYWRLCWPSYEGASEYELQSLTSEGASNKFRRQREGCFRIEVAAGQNPKSQGLRDRDLQLALRSTELSYRVRAVLADGRFSEWSQPLTVAQQTSNKDP